MRPVFHAAAAGVLTAVLLPSVARTQTASAPARTAIVDVTVIDVTTGRRQPHVTVVVEGTRIARIDATAKSVPPGATVVDGAGRYLIPGLWDFHVHSAYPGLMEMFAPMYIANGITGIREMFGMTPVIKSAMAREAKGELLAPRVVGSGHIVDGPNPIWPGSVRVTSAEDGRRAVDSLAAQGSDFIKIYSLLSRDAFLGIAREAKARGIRFAGHVPEAVSVAEASDAGMASMEHLNGFPLACSSKGDSLRAERAAMSVSLAGLREVGAKQGATVAATYDAAVCRALFAKLVKNQSWQVPTLVVNRNMANLDDTTFALDPRLVFLPKGFSAQWNPKTDFRLKDRTPAAWAAARRNYDFQRRLVKPMADAGVPMLAGTDVMNPYVFPGFSLHDELGLLVEAGLTPLQALQAATINPARWLNATDSLGTVSKGKVADLVLLDADPLADIGNTRTIRGVWTNGRYLDRAALDALLAKARQK